ncbi:hypothetical protein MRB53_019894 [Persea americana]|uniref:Uncharacterized protein n=1 Tax=Persea americana TaxID=3435 RepID=A0ACC2KZQ8_PERAE|nr:hypothetical protein MRB53_019894 [Persea americana]
MPPSGLLVGSSLRSALSPRLHRWRPRLDRGIAVVVYMPVLYLRDGTGGDSTGANQSPSPCHEVVYLSDPMLILIQ